MPERLSNPLQRELAERFPPVGEVIRLDELPLRAGRLGVGMECLDRDLWDPLPAIPRLRALGIRRARLQSGWGRTEREKGVYDFAWLDEVVEALTGIGVEPWISLSYGNYLYLAPDELAPMEEVLMRLFSGREELESKRSLLYGLGQKPTASPEAMAGWLKYVGAVVARYRGKVRHYEIWNEPDVSVFFPSDSWPDEYLELVRRTAPVIRGADPEARVIGGASGRNRTMELLLGKGLGECVDILSFHGYHEYPEKFGTNAYRAARAALDRYAPRLKLWRGEAGFPSANPKGGNGALCHLSPTEEQQACWIARNVVNDLSMKELDFYSYFHLYDFLHFSRRYRYHYGLLREDYSPKPSYRVLQRCAKLLDGDTVPADDLLMTPGSGPENIQVNAIVRGFRRRGAPVFACWIADGADGAFRSADFNFWTVGASEIRTPVAIDPVTGKVHPLRLTAAGTKLEEVPLMPYPLIVSDLSAFADVVALTGGVAAAKTDGGAAETQSFEA